MACYQCVFLINKELNIWLVTFSFLNILNRQTIYNHHQLRVVQGNTADRRIVAGKLESTLFKSLIVKNKTGSLPMQQLDFIFALVDENKYIATGWVAAKLVLHKPRKPIETFAHIGGLAVQMKTVLGR